MSSLLRDKPLQFETKQSKEALETNSKPGTIDFAFSRNDGFNGHPAEQTVVQFIFTQGLFLHSATQMQNVGTLDPQKSVLFSFGT